MSAHDAKLTSRQRPASGFWPVLNRLLMGLIFVVIIVLGILAFIPEIQKHRAEQAEVRRLQNEIRNQEAIHRRQTQEIDLLRSNPEYVELIARDKMDLMKEGETIFRLDTTGAISSTPPVLPALPPEN